MGAGNTNTMSIRLKMTVFLKSRPKYGSEKNVLKWNRMSVFPARSVAQGLPKMPCTVL